MPKRGRSDNLGEFAKLHQHDAAVSFDQGTQANNRSTEVRRTPLLVRQLTAGCVLAVCSSQNFFATPIEKTLSTYLALLAKEASLLHIAMGTEYPTALRLHQGL